MCVPKFSFALMLVLTVSLLLGACSLTTESSMEASSIGEKANDIYTGREFPRVESEYVRMPYKDMIQEADFIVAATVATISDTVWNQDSGEYWEETTTEGEYSTTHRAMPVYSIQLVVERVISGEIEEGERINITSTGISPNQRTVDNELYQEFIDLAVGDQIIGFLENGSVAWRDSSRPIELAATAQGDQYVDIGTRSIVGWLVDPKDTFLIKRNDGLYHSQEGSSLAIEMPLDELTTEIQESRDSSQ